MFPAGVGAFPIAMVWIVVVPLWLTYLVHKADKLDAAFDELHDWNPIGIRHDRVLKQWAKDELGLATRSAQACKCRLQ